MLKARKEKIEQLKSSILEQEKMFRAEAEKTQRKLKGFKVSLTKSLNGSPERQAPTWHKMIMKALKTPAGH